jgi:prevent-host-death family protein
MRIKEAVKSITYLKDNAAEVVRDAAERGTSLIVTQNGEAKAAVMGVRQYREWRETLALLKIVALGELRQEIGTLAPQHNSPGCLCSRARTACPPVTMRVSCSSADFQPVPFLRRLAAPDPPVLSQLAGLLGQRMAVC